MGLVTGEWPPKSAEMLLDMLKNMESNTELKSLAVDCLVLHPDDKSPKMCCQTYKAHSWISPNMYSLGNTTEIGHTEE